jgi:hypothetical protein
MARMPDATWRPLPLSPRAMSRFDIVCIHTMVGTLDGTDGYFRRSGISSHFGTGGDGRIYQWLDTGVQSGANYNGNHRCISIENADIGPEFGAWNTNDGGAVPAFTAKQIEAIARIVAWACKTHNIPCELVPDSKPTRRGVAYHRQGVIGYMVAGGEQWSKAVGKVCPGNRRIAQIPQIITRARQIMGGAPVEEDELMAALTAQDEAQIKQYGGLIEAAAARSASHIATAANPWGLDALRRKMDALSAQIAGSPDRIAAAVVAALPESGSGEGGALTRSDVEAAVRDVLGSLDAA